MASGDFVAAERLLKALRAAGCGLAVDGENLMIEGELTDGVLAAIRELKPSLIALLIAEALSPPDASASTSVETEARTPPESTPSLPVGAFVATAEWLRWQGLRNQAACEGRRFDLPPPNWVLRG